ncbi:DNA-binding MarR family transcriptional regulator [Gillisia sp. Hel_I_86]|uniref:MarR family winged helix-turn-helix transcriptional regulator n=1 Tax=Gillisia sp. Hel_I_86 TaxID=1249981 RepID=UPI001198F7BB|nr:MarR family transcriptional regulator [Gillisia sp. Hel_I_86]TVZ27432.1 DNA-binding MarR family transcriptional regulator [Gillisia sp. Hel_I_86]
MKIEKIINTENELPPSRKLILSILLSTNVINDTIAETLKPFELSIPQFNVLRILRGQKGKPANLSTIQERMVSKMSNTTRLVDKLIAKDLVSRMICEKNRRKVEITITKKGLDLLSELDPTINETESELTENLSLSEITTLYETLQKLLK